MADKELDDIFYDGDGPLARAKHMLEQNAPFAVAAVLDVMNHSTSDTARLRAANEVLTRTIGKDSEGGALEEFIKGLERAANVGK